MLGTHFHSQSRHESAPSWYLTAVFSGRLDKWPKDVATEKVCPAIANWSVMAKSIHE
jgi:hypothetical protein